MNVVQSRRKNYVTFGLPMPGRYIEFCLSLVPTNPQISTKKKRKKYKHWHENHVDFTIFEPQVKQHLNVSCLSYGFHEQRFFFVSTMQTWGSCAIYGHMTLHWKCIAQYYALVYMENLVVTWMWKTTWTWCITPCLLLALLIYICTCHTSSLDYIIGKRNVDDELR